MNRRESKSDKSTSEQQTDSWAETLAARAAAYGEEAADAMLQCDLLASDTSRKAIDSRLRLLRTALTAKGREIRLLQRAGLLPCRRRRVTSRSRQSVAAKVRRRL